MSKNRYQSYDKVMSRVHNNSKASVRSNPIVTRHEFPSTGRVGAKPSVSNVSSGIFSELPTVLNDYVPESPQIVKRSSVVKPKRTLKSLDPAKSPPRLVPKARVPSVKPRISNTQSSAPSIASRRGDGWSDTHVRQCYSSRSHTRLKELKEEIKAYHETDKLLKIRRNLYKRCGVVLDDEGQVATDKAVQVEPPEPAENDDSCKKHWKNLKDTYFRQKRKNKGGTESSGPKNPRSKFRYYAKLFYFLDTIPKERSITSNIDPDDTTIQESQNSPVLTQASNFFHIQVQPDENSRTDVTSPTPSPPPPESPAVHPSVSFPKSNRKRPNQEDILTYLQKREECRQETLEKINEKIEDDDLLSFSEHVKIVLKKLPPILKLRAKKEIFDILLKYEFLDIESETESVRPGTS